MERLAFGHSAADFFHFNNPVRGQNCDASHPLKLILRND